MIVDQSYLCVGGPTYVR